MHPSEEQAEVDYYTILGVRLDATQEEIRAAYWQVSKQHHPDWGGTHAGMKAVNQAYAVLKDPDLRAAYDAQRTRSAVADTGVTWEASHPPQSPPGRPPAAWPMWVSGGFLVAAMILWLYWGYQAWHGGGWDIVVYILFSEVYWGAVLWLWHALTTVMEGIADLSR